MSGKTLDGCEGILETLGRKEREFNQDFKKRKKKKKQEQEL